MLQENNQDRPTFQEMVQKIKDHKKYEFDESYKLEISNKAMSKILMIKSNLLKNAKNFSKELEVLKNYNKIHKYDDVIRISNELLKDKDIC